MALKTKNLLTKEASFTFKTKQYTIGVTWTPGSAKKNDVAVVVNSKAIATVHTDKPITKMNSKKFALALIGLEL